MQTKSHSQGKHPLEKDQLIKKISLDLCISANWMPISNSDTLAQRETQEDSLNCFLNVLSLFGEELLPIKGNTMD